MTLCCGLSPLFFPPTHRHRDVCEFDWIPIPFTGKQMQTTNSVSDFIEEPYTIRIITSFVSIFPEWKVNEYTYLLLDITILVSLYLK